MDGHRRDAQLAEPAGSADPSAELDRAEAALVGVEAALARLDDGTYGTCEVCRTRLDDALLAADPLARHCPGHA